MSPRLRGFRPTFGTIGKAAVRNAAQCLRALLYLSDGTGRQPSLPVGVGSESERNERPPPALAFSNDRWRGSDAGSTHRKGKPMTCDKMISCLSDTDTYSASSLSATVV